jgi:hypothetical protein
VKFLCSHCDRLLPVETFRLEGTTLVVTCPKCASESRVEPAGAAPKAAPLPEPARAPPRLSLASVEGSSNVVVLRTASHDAVQRASSARANPFAIPDGLCPKCLARKGDAPTCAHCGVTFEVFEEATVLPPKFLRDEWLELLGDWGNEQRHTQFRRKAQQVDALPAVGRLYRLRQAHFAEDPLAAEALTDILRLASVPMALPRTEDEGGFPLKNVVLGGLAILTLGLLVVILKMLFSMSPTPQ